MTALEQYQRLEASGLWRPSPEAQRREVIVSVGEATLVIRDPQERPLTHWSLAAIARAGDGDGGAVYHPDGDPGETLELDAGEAGMIEAIEMLRAAVERRRPRPGRLRLAAGLALLALLATASVWWLPPAVRAHAIKVVPEVRKAEIGTALLLRIERITGPPCTTIEGRAALGRLAARIPTRAGPGQLMVMRDAVRDTLSLPGGTVLIARALVEDYDNREVLAGYLLAERLRTERTPPLARLLEASPVWASFRLLTTGVLDDATLDRYAEALVTTPPPVLDDATLLAGFEAMKLRATPYAYALDITGEATIGLIEADPLADAPPAPVVSDADWQRLQGICGA